MEKIAFGGYVKVGASVIDRMTGEFGKVVSYKFKQVSIPRSSYKIRWANGDIQSFGGNDCLIELPEHIALVKNADDVPEFTKGEYVNLPDGLIGRITKFPGFDIGDPANMDTVLILDELGRTRAFDIHDLKKVYSRKEKKRYYIAVLKRDANDMVQETQKVKGVTFYIEWPVGSVRYYPRTGYRTPMKCNYGFIPRTLDEDGDDEEIDAYLVPEATQSPIVFEIEQIKPDTGKFDEIKYMVGFDSENEAKEMYLAHIPAKFFGSIRAMNWGDFTDIIKEQTKV